MCNFVKVKFVKVVTLHDKILSSGLSREAKISRGRFSDRRASQIGRA